MSSILSSPYSLQTRALLYMFGIMFAADSLMLDVFGNAIALELGMERAIFLQIVSLISIFFFALSLNSFALTFLSLTNEDAPSWWNIFVPPIFYTISIYAAIELPQALAAYVTELDGITAKVGAYAAILIIPILIYTSLHIGRLCYQPPATSSKGAKS